MEAKRGRVMAYLKPYLGCVCPEDSAAPWRMSRNRRSYRRRDHGKRKKRRQNEKKSWKQHSFFVSLGLLSNQSLQTEPCFFFFSPKQGKFASGKSASAGAVSQAPNRHSNNTGDISWRAWKLNLHDGPLGETRGDDWEEWEELKMETGGGEDHNMENSRRVIKCYLQEKD